jgi:hypothetical protein
MALLCCVVHVLLGAYRVTFVAEVLPVGLDEVANGSNTNHQPRDNTPKITPVDGAVISATEMHQEGNSDIDGR